MEPVVYTLESPIPDGKGNSITQLTFREATAEDACLTDNVKGDFQSSLAMLASMCGTPLPLMKKLKLRELNKILKVVGPLMGNDNTEATSAG